MNTQLNHKKIIIAGSRSITNTDILLKAIEYAKQNGINPELAEEIVCGAASGVDTLGSTWAHQYNIQVSLFPAKWKDLTVEGCKIGINKFGGKYNRMAGFQRNQQMAEYADALICIIQNNSKGSLHMVECMKKLNKPYIIYEVK